jgi:hypothetical protein
MITDDLFYNDFSCLLFKIFCHYVDKLNIVMRQNLTHYIFFFCLMKEEITYPA